MCTDVADSSLANLFMFWSGYIFKFGGGFEYKGVCVLFFYNIKVKPATTIHVLLFLISSKAYFVCTHTHHGLCCTSYGALTGTKNNFICLPSVFDPMNHHTQSGYCTIEQVY